MFHKHGRIAFGVLTIVIIIPFVLYFSATPDDILNMFSLGNKKSNVSMYGETISKKKLDQNITNVMIAMTLRGYQLNFETARDQQEILQEALNRIRLLTTADKKGIVVDDMQIASYIRNIHLFQKNGQFDLKMYNMFVRYILNKYRLGDKEVESVARENLIIDILKKQIEDSVVVTEAGAREFYNASHESYNVKVAAFDSSDYLDSIKVNEEVLKKYFDLNSNKYLIPARYKADVVRFNFISFNKAAAEKITDDEINSHYLQDKNLYKDIDEKEAKEKIKKDLTEKECNKLAKNKAQKFAVDAFKLIEHSNEKKPAIAFENLALKNNFKVHHIQDWFDAETGLIPKLGKLPEVVKEITHLYIDQPITNAILDKNAYFVACLTGKEAAGRAKYPEVKDKVKKDFVNEKALELAQASAKAVSTKIASALKEESNHLTDTNFKSFPAFTPANPMPVIKEKNGYQVFQEAVQTREGTISRVANTPNGAIIVYVDKITLPSNEEFKKEKTVNLANYKEVVQQTAWSNFLLMLKQNSCTEIKSK